MPGCWITLLQGHADLFPFMVKKKKKKEKQIIAQNKFNVGWAAVLPWKLPCSVRAQQIDDMYSISNLLPDKLFKNHCINSMKFVYISKQNIVAVLLILYIK